jgi:hypothetical protein
LLQDLGASFAKVGQMHETDGLRLEHVLRGGSLAREGPWSGVASLLIRHFVYRFDSHSRKIVAGRSWLNEKRWISESLTSGAVHVTKFKGTANHSRWIKKN